ncbi:VWA domain-containing protein [Thermodesulfobacteriota bacterium]
MKKQPVRQILFLGVFIAITCTAMAFAVKGPEIAAPDRVPPIVPDKAIVSLAANLTQSKIVTGGDGKVALALTLAADEVIRPGEDSGRNVDMVVVLDRSGSMQGPKINDARQAILRLIDSLTEKDRFALVSYSDGVRRHTGLLNATPDNRQIFIDQVTTISAQGGTNLGAGLQEGLALLQSAAKNGNLGRVILISDGQANQGITDPAALGNLAATSVASEFAVTTVGVGLDFNEYLMTHIADRGTGNYYFLENPNAFAEVFLNECNKTRIVAATSVEIRIPLQDDITLFSAAGYPIEVKNNQAIFRPGDLLSGQTRKLFITLRMPTDRDRSFNMQGIQVAFSHENKPMVAELDTPFRIDCVKNQQDVYGSIVKEEWEQKVMQEDLNRLREQVAGDIKAGKKEDALEKIAEYRSAVEEINTHIGSESISQSLSKDLSGLGSTVTDTFSGAPSAVAIKQKKNAKSMQYQGVQGMRGKH